TFWSRLRLPGAAGFPAEIWPTLAAAAREMFPIIDHRVPPRERVAAGAEPRLAWIEEAAAALGMPALELSLVKGGDPAALSVVAGGAATRFRIGRALGLLGDRAVLFDRLSGDELGTLLAAAAIVAGAPAAAAGAGRGVEERARLLGKAMSRKERKAPELEASR